MKKIISIVFIVLRLFLGGMMVYGGVQKFANPMPTSTEVIQKASKFSSPGQEGTQKIILYINGMKQTGYFWEVLGICEILFGLLLIAQGTAFVGAVFLLPITLHIFLFHLFLEPDETGELMQTFFLLLINMALVMREKAKWKSLLWIKPY